MLLDFFPSRTLTWYLGKTFMIRILAVLVMLVLVLMMLDLLSNTGEILAHPGNGEAELLRYVSLRVPQLARFLPYSVLLATIITLARLQPEQRSHRDEGGRPVGASGPRPAGAHGAAGRRLLASLSTNAIVTRATAALKAWQAAEFGPVPDDPSLRANIYLNDGNDVMLASSVAGKGAGTVMRGVTFYERDEAGMIVRQLRAPIARWADPGWRLEQARQFEVGSADAAELADPVTVAPGITLGQITLRKIDADAEPIDQLAELIQALDAAGRRTAELDGKWWHKISGPLSTLLMPLLGAVAGFGLARSGHLLARAMIGMALGFAFFVVDNAALAMGSFGGYPPLLAAWAPFVLFFLLGETVLIRTEE